MLSLPIPRRSFLDSSLRRQSHESRRLPTSSRTGDTHLGHGHRDVTPRPSLRSRFLHPAPRGF